MQSVHSDPSTPTNFFYTRNTPTMGQDSDTQEADLEKWPSEWHNDVVYLNNAGEAKLSPAVQAAGIAALSRAPWEIDVGSDRQRIRELFATVIGTDAKNVAIVPSTAFAMTMAARNIQRCLTGEVGRILVLDDQMCSAIYPWQEICSASNYDIQLEIVPYPDHGRGWTETVLKRMNDDILVVCLPPLHWSDGALVDLEAIGAACRLHGSIFIVDATQAVGIIPCDVSKYQPALLACSVHKWLRGPPGMSLVYVAPSLHDVWSPLDLHGRSRDFAAGKDWDAWRNDVRILRTVTPTCTIHFGLPVMSPTGYEEKFVADARKFDSGGKANPLLIPMLRASLEEVAQIDTADAQKKLRALIAPLVEWAPKNDYIISPGPHASHMIGIRPTNRTTEEMLEMCNALKRQGIYIAVRCGVFRISPYLTNTDRDIERLIQGLEELRK
eukprot:scaffold2195_cov132-Cylindrotheca_fusiformis.AAC.10